MSLKRDSIPPPRPPAPKSFTRRSASNNSIKKSFKLLEEDEEDEEDLTVLTGEFDKKLDKSKADASKGDKSKESTPVKTASSTPQNESKTLGLNQRSRSLDDDKSSSNVSRIKQNFVDISSGLKDKLAKKWEEISAEINSPVDGNTDQKTEEMVNQNTEFSRLDVRRLEIQMSDNGEENLIIETAKNSALDEHIKDEPDKKVLVRSQRLPPTPEETPVDSTGTIQIVDDFFPTEPSDSSVGANVQSNELRQRKNSSLKKILKNKGSKASNSPTGTPVSMSKLMTKNDTEDQDIEVQSANTEFFDASDMDLTSNNSVQSDPISGNDQKLKLPTGHVKMSDLTAVPVRKLTAGSIFIFFYWILPLPSYISGMLMGMFLACAGWAVYLWLNKPPTQKPPIERLPVNKLPPMVVPEMKDVVTEDGVYKGWMNEIPIYNPEKYHINQTHSIYVDLENAALRLRRPKTNIAKRSMWDEPPIQTPQFIHQRHYNLEGSKVFLVPPGLVKKRIWSKKYPICVALASVDPKHHAMVNEQKLAETPDSESGFEIITDQNCGDGVLFLFARTCREKEDWYKRFTAAAAGKPLPSHLGLIRKCISKTKSPSQLQSRDNNTEGVLQHKRQGSTDSTSSGSSSPTKEQEDVPVSSQSSMEDFIRFMGRVMPKEVKDSQSSPTHVKKGTPEYVSPIDCDFSILWLNALINRVFWDFLHEQYFIDKVLDKLQRKLSKIHIPYFIEELKITNIDLGNEVPSLRRGARPYFDEQGFWVDVDINYEGGFQMTIETKVNLMRLKKTTTADKQEEGSARKSAITDEDEEDSAESSSDEEEDASSPCAEDGARGGKASRKIMGYLGKITQSKYFQSATEIKYIKKKMEEVSNTPIELTVEVRILSGTMAVNIPPPPTDRLWYGFRGSPKLQLVAKPKVGARELTLTHITEWIEKKLSTEFQRTFVYPNLDDLEVPTFTTYTPSGVDPPGLSGNL